MAHEDTTTATPSPWVDAHAGLIVPGGRVLDLACGRGRHTRYLAERGFQVVAVDRNLTGVADLAGDSRIELIEADLENDPWPFVEMRFDGIVICNYLHRPHFPLLINSLNETGVLILDSRMLGMNRFDLQERMNELASRLQIIIVTSDAHPGDRDHAVNTGAIGFLQKPFEEKSLLELTGAATDN